MSDTTITVEFRVNRKDLLQAAGMISRASTKEAFCDVIQYSLYDSDEGPKLQGSYSIESVKSDLSRL